MADFTTNTDFDSWDDAPASAVAGADTDITPTLPADGSGASDSGDPTADDTGAASNQTFVNPPDPATPVQTSASPPRRGKLYGEDIARDGIDYYTAIGNSAPPSNSNGSGQSNTGQASSAQSISLQAWNFANPPFSSYQFRPPGTSVSTSNSDLPPSNSDLTSQPGSFPSYSFPFRSPNSGLRIPSNPILPSWSFDRPPGQAAFGPVSRQFAAAPLSAPDPAPLDPAPLDPAPLDPAQFPVTAAQQKLQAAQQAAADSRQRTAATLQSLGVPPADTNGAPIDLDTTGGDDLRAHVDDTFDQESALAEANARRLWSFDGKDLTARAQALRTDIERRRAQAQAALGNHLQARDAVQKASDQFDQVRAPYAVDNVRQLQALNLRRVAAGQPPVPVPPEWLRLAALANPPPASSSSSASASQPAALPPPSSPQAALSPSSWFSSSSSPSSPQATDDSPPDESTPASSPVAATRKTATDIPGIPEPECPTPAVPGAAAAAPQEKPNLIDGWQGNVERSILIGAHGFDKAIEGMSRFVRWNALADYLQARTRQQEAALAGEPVIGSSGKFEQLAPATGVGRVVSNLTGGLISQAPAIALGGIPGLIALGIQAMGEASATAHDQVKAQGASDEDATKAAGIAALKTLPQTALYALAGTATRGLLKNIQPLVASPLGRAAAAFLAGTAGNLAAGFFSKFVVGDNPWPSVDDIVDSIVFAAHGARTEHQIGRNLATARAIVDGTHPDMAILDAVAQGKVPKATAEDRRQAGKVANAYRAAAQSYLRKARPDVSGYPLLDGAPPPGTQPFAHVSGPESPDHSAAPQTIPGFPPAADGDAATPSIPATHASKGGGDGSRGNSGRRGPAKPPSPPKGEPTSPSKAAKPPPAPPHTGTGTAGDSSPYQIHIDPITRKGPMAIDTSKFTSGHPTMDGGKREARFFWKAWAKAYPQTLSQDNAEKIKNKEAPIVDSKWLETFPEHRNYIGERLEHHHINYGPDAISLPEPVHRREGWGYWHPKHARRK